MKEILKQLVPNFLLGWYHFLMVLGGALWYGFPSRKLKVIGVTGTNGKSTVVHMVSAILEEAGSKTASISSVRFKIGKKERPNTLKMTMPGRLKLQRFLKQAVRAGCQYAVLEVTSEGIKQHRHRFIDFEVAVLTNLKPEHIEAHGGFEQYREAKGQLFKALKRTANSEQRTVSIVNLDDENKDYFLGFPAAEKWGYETRPKTKNQKPKIQPKNLKNVTAQNIEVSQQGLKFSVRSTAMHLRLLGAFNVSNALAAICVGLSQGIALATIKRGLEKMSGVPGRMEMVIKEPFRVIVDYAHTPDALEKVYQTFSNERLICVLGSCGGGRDTWKRPELGKIAVRSCDQIILTNEDPYDEDPNQILSEIKAGIPNVKTTMANVFEILDRRKAIREALQLAKPGDTVIITGKGSEPWLCVAGGRKIPWDDRRIVREELQTIEANSLKPKDL